MAEVQHSSSEAESAAEKLPPHGIDKHKLSFGQIGQTKEPSLHPVKLHLSDQPKSGLPSSLTQSFQPETPEHLQEDQDRALSTIYSGLTYSGRSSGGFGDRASPVVASNSPHLGADGSKQASGHTEAMMCGQEAEAAQVSSDSSPGFCQPGISPFSLAPLPLSRAGSESLPALPSLQQATPHQGRVSDLAAKPSSRLRHQAGPGQHSGVASRSASGLVKSYPGLEHTSPVQSMLKKSLSRSLSSWLQSSLNIQHAGDSKSQQSRQQSAELMSKAMSNALSAQLYPGLEGVISNWAQQAQHDKSHAQPSGNPASRAASGLYPGLERAISSWAQQAQHDSSFHQSSGSPASRAASGLYPGLERASSDWAQRTQHDSSYTQPSGNPASRASSGMYPGLERSISHWAQHAQHGMSNTQSSTNPASRASSGLYPGLERAISNWAQQAHQGLPEPQSIARAVSGMSGLPGLEQAISSWAQQAQCEVRSEESSPEGKHAPSTARAMSGLLEGLYPGLERALSNWAQQGQDDLCHTSDPVASAARAMSGMSDTPGLESDMPCPTQQAEQLQEALPRAVSVMSECLYPGLEQAILAFAQQAQHDSHEKEMSSAASIPRSMSEVSEAWCPGLERAISNWAQQAQHDIIRSLQTVAPAQSGTPGVPECLYSGLEQAMTDFAQQAHCEIVSRLQSNASDCMYCPGLEGSEDLPSPEQQQAGTQSSSSHGAALAQATGEAILAAAKLDDPAAAAKTVAEAVTEAVAGEVQAEAVREAVTAAVTEAVPKAARPSPAVDEASHSILSRAGSGSPKVMSRASTASPKVADLRQMPRAAQANKMLKVHSRDLGQHQQNKHAKLHQNVLSLIGMLHAEGGPGQGLKPVAAENFGVEPDSNVSMSPLSLQGVAKGVEMQSPGSPGKTADRMAQALRHRELEQMPHMVSASGTAARGSTDH